MKFLSIQEALNRKIERQAAIEELEYHASGHCVHVGELSPGCYQCFVPDRFSINLHIGSQCNLNCPYCPGVPGIGTLSSRDLLVMKGRMLHKALKAKLDHTIPTISFTGGGEPLMHLDIITDMIKFCKDIEQYMRVKPWYYLYTNGVLADLDAIMRLTDSGFDEIRFHLGASGFSKKVYKNLELAARYLDTVTVETPAWPPHRDKLFDMLPIIDDIGVKHLNIGEIWLTEHNRERIAKMMPEAQVYQCHLIHLYDGGLVYDLIEEVLRRGYSFSVLDCNCLVKSIQRSPGKRVMHEPVKGLCKDRDPYNAGEQLESTSPQGDPPSSR